MRDNKLHTPDGMADYLPGQLAFKTDIERRMEAVFQRYGYESVSSPMFEYIEVFEGIGSVNPAQMYRFTDRDGSTLALRADITPAIARIAATAYAREELPLRFCYCSNAFRENESYRGKLNEFTQAGVELIGAHSTDACAEVIAVAINSLLAAGAEGFRLDIGQIDFVQGVMEDCGFDETVRDNIAKYIIRRDYVALDQELAGKDIPDGARRIFSELALMIGGKEILERARGLTASKKALAALDELERVYDMLRHYDAQRYVSFDLSMLGYLDYYSGVIFRGYMKGTGSSILGGGTYDGLLAKFGKDYPAVGFSVKLNALLSLLMRQDTAEYALREHTLLAYTEEGRAAAISVADGLRAQGLTIINSMLGGNFQMNYAYALRRGIGGLLFFTNDDTVRVVDIANDEDNVVSISELLSQRQA